MTRFITNAISAEESETPQTRVTCGEWLSSRVVFVGWLVGRGGVNGGLCPSRRDRSGAEAVDAVVTGVHAELFRANAL